MADRVERFFQGCIDAFNRSLGESGDVSAIRAHFSPCFVAAGPRGVNCGQNDDSFVEMLQQGYAFYTALGTKAMTLRGNRTTPIDDGRLLAGVDYRATYEIFAYVAGDEVALYRKHGLVPA